MPRLDVYLLVACSYLGGKTFVIIIAVQMGSHSKNKLGFIILLITAESPCCPGIHWHRIYVLRVASYMLNKNT